MNTDSPYAIADFSPHLFQNMERDKRDWERDVKIIIKQTLESGRMSDWRMIQRHYGLAKIGVTATEIDCLDALSIAFLSVVTGLPKADFTCCSEKFQRPRQWLF